MLEVRHVVAHIVELVLIRSAWRGVRPARLVATPRNCSTRPWYSGARAARTSRARTSDGGRPAGRRPSPAPARPSRRTPLRAWTRCRRAPRPHSRRGRASRSRGTPPRRSTPARGRWTRTARRRRSRSKMRCRPVQKVSSLFQSRCFEKSLNPTTRRFACTFPKLRGAPAVAPAVAGRRRRPRSRSARARPCGSPAGPARGRVRRA